MDNNEKLDLENVISAITFLYENDKEIFSEIENFISAYFIDEDNFE